MLRLIASAVTVIAWTFALLANTSFAETSAPSSHFVFDDSFPGDIIINEVRVPSGGEAMYTYYEALGWRGKGAGYAGIQVHPKAHLFIFSIWDNKLHTAPIRAVHHGPGTETVGFGGEGTGLKSWNFELGWKADVWYTLVARTWPVGDHSFYGFWARAGDTQRWTHLVTMDVAVSAARFEGRTDAFIEDWHNTGAKPRTTHLRNGWKRKTDGQWFPFGSGRYSVNAWDLEPGKRSYQFRDNWNGGVAGAGDAKYYFMISGGKETAPTSKNPSNHTIPRTKITPSYRPLESNGVQAELDGEGRLSIAWENDPTTLPQFSYSVKVFDNQRGDGDPLVWQLKKEPHVRSITIAAANIPPADQRFAQLQIVDILGNVSASKTVRVVADQATIVSEPAQN